MLLTAELPCGDDTYDVDWTVEGPVQLSQQDTRVVLLGATTVTGNRIDPGQRRPRRPSGRPLDTSPLIVGSWQVRLSG